MSGQELFETLVQNTGLPDDYVRVRFQELIQKRGFSIEALDLENVREVLAELLLDLIQQSSMDV